MLRNKVSIESIAHQFSKKNSSLWQTERICRFCKTTFCCKKCRNRHVDKVHPGLNADCSLCASKVLPVRQFEIEKSSLEDEQLLCHIVDKHLPLHCQLCGNLVASKEDFRSIGACKWWSQNRHPLTSPRNFEPLENKLKQCFLSDSDYNGSRFSTPSEIHRKTSTPRLIGEKASFEYQTPCAPNFSLKITPKTNSPSITQKNTSSKTCGSQSTMFLSFSPHNFNEEMTPFKINKEEQFLRTNSGRKLDIMEECDEIVDYKDEKIANNSQVSSTVDMDLTDPVSDNAQSPPESDAIREEPCKTPDIVKKVRFSDHYDSLEFKSLTESCMKTVLNMSGEEEDDVFQNVHEASDTQDAKDAKDAKDTENTKDTRDTTENLENKKNMTDSQAKDKKCSVKFLTDSQIKIIQDNIKNDQNENHNPEVKNDGSLTSSEQGSKLLMMVLVENNSGRLNTDLMPLIDSGLKKLHEQLALTNCQSSSATASSANLRRKSITKMEMSVSTVESNFANSAATIKNHRQIMSSSSVQNGESNNIGGFLSTVAQAMKSAFKSFSVLGMNLPSRSIETTEVIRRQEIVKESISSQGSSTDDTSSSGFINNIKLRSGKRARDVSDASSKVDSIARLDGTSPLAKRQRGWYTMIRGRPPISRMRENHTTTSPRGVSAETQVFSQGSLTVGDTILPLPARAHQSTQTE